MSVALYNYTTTAREYFSNSREYRYCKITANRFFFCEVRRVFVTDLRVISTEKTQSGSGLWVHVRMPVECVYVGVNVCL